MLCGQCTEGATGHHGHSSLDEEAHAYTGPVPHRCFVCGAGWVRVRAKEGYAWTLEGATVEAVSAEA
jgi:hypothetical protein